jgi:hypothetical protein
MNCIGDGWYVYNEDACDAYLDYCLYANYCECLQQNPGYSYWCSQNYNPIYCCTGYCTCRTEYSYSFCQENCCSDPEGCFCEYTDTGEDVEPWPSYVYIDGVPGNGIIHSNDVLTAHAYNQYGTELFLGQWKWKINGSEQSTTSRDYVFTVLFSSMTVTATYRSVDMEEECESNEVHLYACVQAPTVSLYPPAMIANSSQVITASVSPGMEGEYTWPGNQQCNGQSSCNVTSGDGPQMVDVVTFNNNVCGSATGRIAIIGAALSGEEVFDPKLENSGSADIRYTITAPSENPYTRVRLSIYNGTDLVASIRSEYDQGPQSGQEYLSSWDGKWGNTTTNAGKYADPGSYSVKLDVFDGTASMMLGSKVFNANIVRLGVNKIGYVSNEVAAYHKTSASDATDIDAEESAIAWKIEHLDFRNAAGRTSARVEQSPIGESYADTDNVLGRTGSESYDDEDGNGIYTDNLRQINFPPQNPTVGGIGGGVNHDRYNRPTVYVRNNSIKIWFDVGSAAKSDITGNDVSVGYPVSGYAIRIKGKFNNNDMIVETGDSDLSDITPNSGLTYELKSSSTLTNKVGYGVENIEFSYQYRKDGTSEWIDIPGRQLTTHLIYRLAATPTSAASQCLVGIGHYLCLKIVDFTSDWANGQQTPEQVFDQIWNSSHFWTPFTTGPRPNNALGFHGTGDPDETTREDMWGYVPKAYSYQHNMGYPNGFTVDWLLDYNQGRCGAFAPFLIAFMGTHGLNADQQNFPAMKWRFVSDASVVSFERNADAVPHKSNGKRPDGTSCQAGDKYYRPLGIWVNSNGQANPFYTNSQKLVSFWTTNLSAGTTDHVFVKYNSRYYDGSYEHAGGASYSSINEKADNGISDYYYDAEFTCNAVGSYQNTTASLPPLQIWLGPFGYASAEPLLIVPNSSSFDEMEEP